MSSQTSESSSPLPFPPDATPRLTGPLVMKFGGSSLRDAERLRQVADRVRSAPTTPLVVVSALGRTTDTLLHAADQARRGDRAGALAALRDLQRTHLAETTAACAPAPLPAGLAAELDRRFRAAATLLQGVAMLRELTPRSRDAIAATGELLSSRILAAVLRTRGIRTAWADARRLLLTDDRFGNARPLAVAGPGPTARRVRTLLSAGRPVITQGFIGATAEGLTTTLGRGGSDWSAALFGAALAAGEVQIWTDVPGVLSGDPRLVTNPLPIPALSFAEAAELAAFGARVLHPATIQPALDAGIPVTVRHTEHPAGPFTTITPDGRAGRPVTALATRGPVTVLTVTSSRMLNQPGFLARLFAVFGRHAASVDLVATAEVSVSLTLAADIPIEPLLAELESFARVTVARDRAIIAVVGERLKRSPGIAARVFQALGDTNAELISMGANEINLSLVVPQAEATAAVRRLHQALIERSVGGAA